MVVRTGPEPACIPADGAHRRSAHGRGQGRHRAGLGELGEAVERVGFRVSYVVVEPVGVTDDVRVRVREPHGRILEERHDALEVVRLPQVVGVDWDTSEARAAASALLRAAAVFRLRECRRIRSRGSRTSASTSAAGMIDASSTTISSSRSSDCPKTLSTDSRIVASELKAGMSTLVSGDPIAPTS